MIAFCITIWTLLGFVLNVITVRFVHGKPTTVGDFAISFGWAMVWPVFCLIILAQSEKELF